MKIDIWKIMKITDKKKIELILIISMYNKIILDCMYSLLIIEFWISFKI